MEIKLCASYFHFVQVGFSLLPAQKQVTFFSGKSNTVLCVYVLCAV